MEAHPRKEDSGASAVEFALLLPLLVVLIFGILFGGLLLNQQLSVTQSAREGARFAATLPIDGAAPDSTWFDLVRDRAVRGSAGTLSVDETICIWFIPAVGAVIPDSGNAGLGCPTNAPGDVGGSDDGDRVVVFAEQPAVLELVIYSFDTAVRARAVARHEGGLGS